MKNTDRGGPGCACGENEPTEAAIELRGLKKDYGNGRGVFGVSFAVERGEVFGFLGPNGAGKTVTMRNLMGFIRPDEGTACIGGLDCFRERARIQERTGYLPGEISCMDEMTGGAFLEFMARMKRMRSRTRMHELMELFELDPSRKVRKMSKGNKQKVGLVCAFMAEPDVVLLDEPTSGLDPLMQNRFIELVQQERERGTTVFLSSHIFEEVERTCDRVAFIRAGKLAAVDRMDVRHRRGARPLRPRPSGGCEARRPQRRGRRCRHRGRVREGPGFVRRRRSGSARADAGRSVFAPVRRSAERLLGKSHCAVERRRP